MAGQAPRAFSKFQMAVAAFGVYSLFGDVFGKSPVQVRAPPSLPPAAPPRTGSG